ncbi:hypothetical protein LOK49_LG15G02002 [Camellia lanceoleosa]|uniref:Uncharacterized protein n=1 Tax=Camellia lanceoleosa TaxID=1840588 RepID=A0ACC0F7B9_9ERIC|nr:hypothetical protein LOK49_LG15G02002 [Camellia lanceoleosa]
MVSDFDLVLTLVLMDSIKKSQAVKAKMSSASNSKPLQFSLSTTSKPWIITSLLDHQSLATQPQAYPLATTPAAAPPPPEPVSLTPPHRLVLLTTTHVTLTTHAPPSSAASSPSSSPSSSFAAPSSSSSGLSSAPASPTSVSTHSPSPTSTSPPPHPPSSPPNGTYASPSETLTTSSPSSTITSMPTSSTSPSLSPTPPSSLRSGDLNQTTLRASFATASSYVDDWAVEGINGERKSHGTVNFNVRLLCRVRFKASWWRARHRILSVYCGDLTVGVSSNGAGGTLVGGARECRVGI